MFASWGMNLASDILKVCGENFAAGIVDTVNSYFPVMY